MGIGELPATNAPQPEPEPPFTWATGDEYTGAASEAVYPTPPTQPKRKPWPLIAAAVVVVLLVAGTAAYLLWPTNLTITGTVVLTAKLDAKDTTCNGAGPFADIREGAQVLVTDGAGATIAVGALGHGKWTAGDVCQFPFTVRAPAGKNVYGVTVGNRKGPTFPEASLAQPVKLSIGS